MFNRSGSILTRGRSSSFYRSGVTPFTSGFIFIEIEEKPIPPTPSVPDSGGRGTSSRRKKEKTELEKKKIIKVTMYINNEKVIKEFVVNENIRVEIEDIKIELDESKKPKIKIRNLL